MLSLAKLFGETRSGQQVLSGVLHIGFNKSTMYNCCGYSLITVYKIGQYYNCEGFRARLPLYVLYNPIMNY